MVSWYGNQVWEVAMAVWYWGVVGGGFEEENETNQKETRTKISMEKMHKILKNTLGI